MAEKSRETGPVIEAHFQFVMWLTPKISKFPRDQKGLLGDRIQKIALDVLEHPIEANYRRERWGHLGAGLAVPFARVDESATVAPRIVTYSRSASDSATSTEMGQVR